MTRYELRAQMAAKILSGLLSDGAFVDSFKIEEDEYKAGAEDAVKYTDALLDRLDETWANVRG